MENLYGSAAGQSSLSALTGVSPGGPGRRGGALLAHHPPLFLSPDSVLAHPRLATHPRLAAHRLPAPEAPRLAQDRSGGGHPVTQLAKPAPQAHAAAAAHSGAPAEESPHAAAELPQRAPAAAAGSRAAADSTAAAAAEAGAAGEARARGPRNRRAAQPGLYPNASHTSKEAVSAAGPMLAGDPDARSCVKLEAVQSPARRTPVKEESPTREAASPSFDTVRPFQGLRVDPNGTDCNEH